MSESSDLVGLTIAAHGGLDRWNEHTSLTARLHSVGALWEIKGHSDSLADASIHVVLHRQFTSQTPLGQAGRRTALTPNHVAIETDSGEVLTERHNPRASFAGYTLETPWDELQFAYFFGYSMWTYLTAPFSFAMPGFRTDELEPWKEDGQTWRRLRVVFPEGIATHCAEQTYYIGEDGLLKRHDYDAEVVGGGPAARYISQYREVAGLMFPAMHKIYAINEDGTIIQDLLFVTTEFDEFAIE